MLNASNFAPVDAGGLTHKIDPNGAEGFVKFGASDMMDDF